VRERVLASVHHPLPHGRGPEDCVVAIASFSLLQAFDWEKI